MIRALIIKSNEKTVVVLFVIVALFGCAGNKEKVYFTNGFRVGEVTSSGITVRTRLCACAVTEISERFRTATSEDEVYPVVFTSSSCRYFWDYDDSARWGKDLQIRVVEGREYRTIKQSII